MNRLILAAAVAVSLQTDSFAAMALPNASPASLSAALPWVQPLLSIGRQAQIPELAAPQNWWWLVKNMLGSGGREEAAALIAPWIEALEKGRSPAELAALREASSNLGRLSPADRNRVYQQLSEAREEAKAAVAEGTAQMLARLQDEPNGDQASLAARVSELDQAAQLMTGLSLYNDNGLDQARYALTQELHRKRDAIVLRMEYRRFEDYARALFPENASAGQAVAAPGLELSRLISPSIEMRRDGGSMAVWGQLAGTTRTVSYDGRSGSPTRGAITVDDRTITRPELLSLQAALPVWADLKPADRELYEAFSSRVARALKRGSEDFSRLLPSRIDKNRGGSYTIEGSLDGEEVRVTFDPWFAGQDHEQTSASIGGDAERLLSSGELEALKRAIQEHLKKEAVPEQREYYGYVLAARA